jgi:hypothetical protein
VYLIFPGFLVVNMPFAQCLALCAVVLPNPAREAVARQVEVDPKKYHNEFDQQSGDGMEYYFLNPA